MLTTVPLPVLFAVTVIETNPDAAVLPPETVESRYNEVVRRQVVDSRQVPAVLKQHQTITFVGLVF